jgi:hypothetical protein
VKGGILPPELRASSWRELTVRDGKGDKDRRTMLPEGGRERLREQLQAVRRLDEKELGNRAATIWIRAWFSKQLAVP